MTISLMVSGVLADWLLQRLPSRVAFTFSLLTGMPETPVPVNNAKKVVAIARQCLDRLEKILGRPPLIFFAALSQM